MEKSVRVACVVWVASVVQIACVVQVACVVRVACAVWSACVASVTWVVWVTEPFWFKCGVPRVKSPLLDLQRGGIFFHRRRNPEASTIAASAILG